MNETAIIFGIIIVGFLLAVWLGLREPKKKESTV